MADSLAEQNTTIPQLFRRNRVGHPTEGIGEDSITVLCGVLIPQRRHRRGMARSTHEFGRRGARRRRPRQARMPKVMESDIGSFRLVPRLAPNPVE